MRKVELVAKLCHEINRAYCESIGDYSQVAWDKAPDWQKRSAIGGVSGYFNGAIRSPEDSHKSWMDLKLKEGWTYGEIKDEIAKLHPCMVPYEQLPKEQKVKDHLFQAICTFFMNDNIILVDFDNKTLDEINREFSKAMLNAVNGTESSLVFHDKS